MTRSIAPQDMAIWSASVRKEGGRIGFVPTMGALHEGHKSLIDRSLKDGCSTVCSIFVNPLQFNNKKDLEQYPRQLENDLAFLGNWGCHHVFTPTEKGIYEGIVPVHHDLGPLEQALEGPLRPGHFQGVVNVVERLFHYVRPDRAYFGEKDRQQLEIIREVTRKDRWPVTIVGCPTLREPDGLAMSSRNQRLPFLDRQRASVLFKALKAIASRSFSATPREAREAGIEALGAEPEVRLEYLEIVDPATLNPIEDWGDRSEAIALIAAHVGPVRLIDNISLHR